MRIPLVAALLLIGVVGCEDGAPDFVCETVCEKASETRCEKASRLYVEAECTPPSGRDYVIDTACEGAVAARCGGAGGDLMEGINAVTGGAISAMMDLCKYNDNGEPNPAYADCRSCIREHCGQTRAECIEDLMGTWYGELVYQCEFES